MYGKLMNRSGSNTMKAVVINDFSGAEKAHIQELPVPEPAPGEIQIKVACASVNPVDWKISEGMLKSRLPHEFPITLGWDAAGVVSEIGQGVTQFSIGDEVYAYCRKPMIHLGTFAEYVCFDADLVARKPKTLTVAEASAIPLTALTAWQALFDVAHLKKGQTVLIHAGAGGVGGMAIQLAKYAGAKVYTTASKKNHDYVKSLGADVAIDYTQEDFVEFINEEEAHGVDLVFDCVGGESLHQSVDIVKEGGHLVTICEFIDNTFGESHGIHSSFIFVKPDGKQLNKLAELIDKGELKAPHIETRPLEQAPEALAQSKAGHTKGKLVLTVA